MDDGDGFVMVAEKELMNIIRLDYIPKNYYLATENRFM